MELLLGWTNQTRVVVRYETYTSFEYLCFVKHVIYLMNHREEVRSAGVGGTLALMDIQMQENMDTLQKVSVISVEHVLK